MISYQTKQEQAKAWTGFLSRAAVAVVALACWSATPAFAQPANDDFANAQIISGANGTTVGSTTGGTREVGEPRHAGSSLSPSVWFSWSCPSNGTATFDTFNSDFDTVLAVYVGDSLNTLSLIAGNDDFGFTLDSRVQFTATAGVDYHIAVAGFASWSGTYRLSWSMSDVDTNVVTVGTNQLQFAFTSYTVDENAPGYATIAVAYGGGASDVVTVDYATTDGTAIAGTDYLSTFGTLIFDIGESNKTFTVPINDNAFVNSNTFFTVFLTNATGGAALGSVTNAPVYIVDDESLPIISTAGQFNFSAASYSVSEWQSSPAPVPPPQVFNPRDLPGALITVTRTGGSTGRVLVDYQVTNFLTLGFSNIISSAEPFLDYLPAQGTLVFDDYQMSTNFIVPVFGSSLTNGPLNPAPVIALKLSNPRPAPGENPFLVRPTLGAVTNASLRLEDRLIPAGWSIEQSNYRADEYENGWSPFYVNIIIAPPYTLPDTVGFRLRNVFGFVLQGSSDYGNINTTIYPDTPYTDGFSGIITNFADVVAPDSFSGNTPRLVQTVQVNTADPAVEFNEDIAIEIFRIPGVTQNGIGVPTATLTVLYNDKPAGMADNEWNPPDVSYTTPPFNTTPGANNNVNAVAVTEDGKSIIGGDFTAYNSTARNRIARLFADGSLDTNFVAGTGADGSVLSIGVYRTTTNTATVPLVGKVVLAGTFTSVDGQLRPGVARLNIDGSLDTAFNPGNGANGPIYSVQILESGKLIIAGAFTTFNSVPRGGVARLNIDGSVDLTFDPGLGANDTIWSAALEGVPPPLIINNSQSGFGPLENRLDIETGRNQGMVTLVWNFWSVPDRITVYYDGTRIWDTGWTNNILNFDPTTGLYLPYTNRFNYGPGVGTVVTVIVNEGGGDPFTVWDYSVRIDSFGGTEKILLGGEFTSVNGVRLGHVARLFANGTVDGTFNPGGGFDGPVYAVASTGNRQVLAGGDFHTIDFRNRNYIARLNENGSVDDTFFPGSGFDAPVYCITTEPDGKAVVGGVFKEYNQTRRVGLARINTDGSVDTAFMDTAYNQFAGVINTFSFQPRNFIRSIANEANGGYIVGGSFTNLGGCTALQINDVGRPSPVWTRQDKTVRFNVARVFGGYTPGPGNVEYAYPYYTADENIGDRYITTRRVNGRLGTATGLFGTTNSTALSGDDYTDTKATLIWPEYYLVTAPRNIGYPGLRYMDLVITNDSLVEGDETMLLGLALPTGSITLGGDYIPLGVGRAISEAPLTIVDNDFDKGTLVFEKRVFSVNENGTNGVISVIRTNGNNGQVSVTYVVRNGSAVAGADYSNVLTGTLTFPSGVTNQTFLVPILNDSMVEVDETISLLLTNATGGAILPGGLDTSTDHSTLVIIDDDYAPGRINFSSLVYATNEGAGLAFITLERLGGNQGPVSADVVVGSASALAGVDFTGFTTNIAWVSGDTSPKSFAVPLLDDQIVETNEIVSLTLTNGRANGVLDPNAVGSRSQAVLVIENDDFPGELAFSQPFFDADENGTNVSITVVRKNGIAGIVSVDYVANQGTATPGVDYVPTTGTLTLGPGVLSKTFPVTLLDDSISDGNKNVELLLTNAVNAGLGVPAAALLTLIDDESFNIPAGTLDSTFNTAAGANNAVYQIGLQPDGRVLMAGDFTSVNNFSRRRIARLFENGDLDPAFNAGAGPNGPIRAMIQQADGRILIGGFFTQVHGTNRNHIARLLEDGTLDSFYNPGAGADSTVFGMALMADGRAVLGGSFNTINGVSRPNIAVLNTNGSLYTGFDPGLGANGTVYAVAVQPADGKILIGGDFTTVNNISRSRIARLLPNGALDLTFNAGEGANSTVRAITVQPDGRILVGGSFTRFAATNRNFMARLETSGALDQSFLGTLPGADNAVYGITLQSDNKILVVGDFTKFNGVTRNRITRLNQNGKTDPTINFGEGANSFIAQAIIQPDRKIIVAGGFTRVQGEPRNRIARLHGGSIAGPGSVEFSAPFYTAVEGQGEVGITVRRTGGTTGDIEVNYNTSDMTASNLLDYLAVSGTLNFPEGEVLQTFTVPVLDDAIVEPAEVARLSLTDPTGGATLGLIPEASLTILSDDSVVSFLTATFSASESAAGGYAPITVVRTGTTNSPATVDYQTLGGTATPGVDYYPTNGTLAFAPGETIKTFNVPILPDTLVEGDETVQIILTNASAGVQYLIASTTLTIVDDDFAPGALGFSSLTYFVNEYETNSVITVVRTNGTTGIVSVEYQTLTGTATPPGDYIATSGTLTFADGETVKTFNVPIVPDYLQETNNETVPLRLFNATGGAVLANNSATLTIIDNNLINGSFSFTATNYVFNESNLVAALTVLRNFGATGQVSVSYQTINGTAVAGTDYVGVTNTLVWTNGEASPKTIFITLLDDTVVESTELFSVQLFNPTGKSTLGLITNTTVLVEDDDFGPGNLGFATATPSWDENGTNALIEVVRTFGHTGDVAIDAATVEGGTAIAGRDYLSTNATLILPDGVTNATFVVPLIGNSIVEGNRTVNLALSNPRNLTTPTNPPSTNGQVIAAVLTIFESSPQAGSIDGSFADFQPNGPVNAILFQTNNGKIIIGGSFTAFAGTPRGYVARLNPSGALDYSFDAGVSVNNTVFALARQSEGRVYVGGAFTNSGSGKVSYLMLLDESGVQDTNFFGALQGVDNLVYSIAVQNDGKVMAGGLFTSVNGTPRRYIARLEPNGALDANFSVGTGPNAAVRAVRVQQDGKAIIAGDFTQISGTNCGRIVRLNQDGSVDAGFASSIGANDSIRAMVLQPDGKVVIAGLFTAVNGQPRNRIARLNDDGSLDTTFDPGVGPDEFISGLALQPSDSRIFVVGAFTQFSGVPRNRIARLNTDGSVDLTINFGSGANNFINAVTLQTDSKILIGGGFTEFDGQPRAYLARLNGGTNIGYGEFVFSAANYPAPESAGDVLITVRRLIGASNAVSVAFATSDGTAVAGINYLPTNGVLNFGPGESVATFTVRMLDDVATNTDRTIHLTLSNPTGGAKLGVPSQATITELNDDAVISFTAATYTVSENVGSAIITLERVSSTVGLASVNYATTDGTANDGQDYTGLAGTVVFTNGQRFASFSVPVLNDTTVEVNETINLALSNPTNAGIGLATATLVVVDDDFREGLITFRQPVYTVGEQAGFATITVERQGGISGNASVRFLTTDGTAVNGVDYRGTNGVLNFADGETFRSFSVPIIDDTLVEGAETVRLSLYDAQGARMGQTNATLSILPDEAIFEFARTNFLVSETNASALITVVRLGGGTGPTSVGFFTYDGIASNGLDYLGTNGTLFFAPGQTSNTFTVAILDDALGEGDEYFGVALTNATGEAILGTNSFAAVTILDNDISFRFAQPRWQVSEFAPGFINVQVDRIGLSNGVVSVNFATSDGTAIAGSDYQFTSARLVFADGQTNASISIPINNDALGEGDEYFFVNLDSPTNGTTLGEPSQARVEILDDEITLAFAQTDYAVDEGASNVVVTVRRFGGAGGVITVGYATSNITAVAGQDYTGVSGILSFSFFEFEKTITIPILEDTLTEGDETFRVRLFSPGGGAAVVAPSNAVVTILDNDTVVQFASVTNSVAEESGPAVIEVQRRGNINTTVQVHYSSTNGTATAGVDYTPVAGTLTFFPGQTNLSITVPIIDDLIIEGNETVTLNLSGVTNAILGARSNTVLTIIDTDASILVSAGVAVTGESVLPANGVIDPNETVTVNFGLRNVGNVDTANLIATLLSTNGVQPQAPVAQNYGVVVAGGNTVSRSYTFKAVGTNGSRIFATFQLADGANNLGQVVVPFTLGRATSIYTNTGAITINSLTNGMPASPYPSVINVTGLTGTVSKVTVTLNNVTHNYAQDVDIMLVGPGGQRVILMSDDGGSFKINNATITFDDAAPSVVPPNSAISSGTYRPTSNTSADSWPPPAPGGPYSSSLSVFSGTAAQGQWSLYVVDDTAGDDGNIAGGWSLNFTIADVLTATSDLAVRVSDSPDPLMVGGVINYTVAVTNFGPSAATGVVLSNQLPAGVTFLSVAPTQGSCTQAGGVVNCSIGALASGGSAAVTISVRTTVPGLLTDIAGVSGAQADVNVANNTHSTKTSVGLTLTYSRQGNNLVISWPASYTGVSVEYSDVIEPAAWMPVTDPPIQSGGTNMLILSPTEAHRFYRLTAP